ncbi:BMC domain-containing protein [Virgibacillus sp. DJP39]|uniref:BMC domain-containing protein n=1 Tax=Virgibacillus sp. DJP39 TaxID=3409790 RepID=UPI003BB694AF
MTALGLIETVGYTTAVYAADAAVKAAKVEIVGMEKVIGVKGYVSVTIHLTGDVAAVTAAVEAGKAQAEAIGEIISTEIIPRLHSDVQANLVNKFLLKKEPKTKKKAPSKKVNKEQLKAEEKNEDPVSEKQTRKTDDGNEV